LAPTPALASFISTLKNDSLKKLVQDLAQDKELSRADMLAIFGKVKESQTVDKIQSEDLQTILGDREVRVKEEKPFKIPDPVWYLSEQVIKKAKESTPQSELTAQVDKWFKGTVPPTNSFIQGGKSTQGGNAGITYPLEHKTLEGSLFASNLQAQIKDIAQGTLGDCYLLAAVGATFGPQKDDGGNQTSSVIKNMIIDNGDGSYTVRFYNISPKTPIPEYVTVDQQAVTFTLEAAQKFYSKKTPQYQQDKVGKLFAATPGKDNTDPQNVNEKTAIWMPLIERAYAQWYQDVKDNKNGYSAIGNAGYVYEALTELTGRGSERIFDLAKQTQLFERIKTALSTGQFVAAGTYKQATKDSNYLMVGGHAYSVTNAYEQGGQKYIVVRNPWGVDGNWEEDQNGEKVKDENGKWVRATRDGVQDGFITLTGDEFKKWFNKVAITKA
jgi:hypothetical protein